MLIFRFMISFLVSTRVALHASMLKKASVFTCWPVQQHSPSLSEMLYFNPPPKYPVCSDWSAHRHLSKQPSLCLWATMSCLQLPVNFTSAENKCMTYANVTW